MMDTVTYTIRRLDPSDIDYVMLDFLEETAQYTNKFYGDKYNVSKFPYFKYAQHHLMWVCFDGVKPVGIMLAQAFGSVFDSNVKIIKQDLLYSKRPNTRVAYLLMQEFIDFGKRHVNYIITSIGSKTNIKPKSLERLGFVKTEEIYTLKVDDG